MRPGTTGKSLDTWSWRRGGRGRDDCYGIHVGEALLGDGDGSLRRTAHWLRDI